MTTSTEAGSRGRGGAPPRPRVLVRLVATGLAVAGVLGAVAYAGLASQPAGDPADDRADGSAAVRGRDALVAGWEAQAGGRQVLGGVRTAGRPTVQRMVHDGVAFTVSVAPARPGPNLVRIDTTVGGVPGTAAGGEEHTGGHGRGRGDDLPPVRVATSASGPLVTARPRPGTDGLWAVVDLPPGSGMVLVSHGPDHRIPFVVSTGARGEGRPASAGWTGADGPECLARATGELLAGIDPVTEDCPAARLDTADRNALVSVVRTLAGRGVRQLAVESDGSPRSRQALAAVRREAARYDVAVVPPRTRPQARSARLVVSGWADAARSLARVSSRPLREQPIRIDGTWLAPWLLSPGVVDSTSGAVIPLGFDIRDPASLAYSQTLAKYLPGQAPTASGLAGWRHHATPRRELRLYAASRAAYLPSTTGHPGHETTISWFPGGTITPIGSALQGS